MKKDLILFSFSFALITQDLLAMEEMEANDKTSGQLLSYRVNPYQGVNKKKQNKFSLSFNHRNRFTKEENVYGLIPMQRKHIDDVANIRCNSIVYQNYANHECPEITIVKKTFCNTFLPRAKGEDARFPFVLVQFDTGNNKETLPSYRVVGLINIGDGYDSNHRMFGYYIDPGRELEPEEVVQRGLSLEEEHYENWGHGLGSIAIKIATHFTMQFQESNRSNEDSHDKISFNGVSRKPFPGALCATSDPDNRRSSQPLQKAGLRLFTEEEVQLRGYSKNLTETVKKLGAKEKIITKNYYEITGEEFKQQKEAGIYKLTQVEKI
ncbi:MAG TPA: hypothetical protein VMW10_02165 [Alphaproteobacteria bacterium]|nr:hypothetical protein [Alphaproteobacteria bacterium]